MLLEGLMYLIDFFLFLTKTEPGGGGVWRIAIFVSLHVLNHVGDDGMKRGDAK